MRARRGAWSFPSPALCIGGAPGRAGGRPGRRGAKGPTPSCARRAAPPLPRLPSEPVRPAVGEGLAGQGQARARPEPPEGRRLPAGGTSELGRGSQRTKHVLQPQDSGRPSVGGGRPQSAGVRQHRVFSWRALSPPWRLLPRSPSGPLSVSGSHSTGPGPLPLSSWPATSRPDPVPPLLQHQADAGGHHAVPAWGLPRGNAVRPCVRRAGEWPGLHPRPFLPRTCPQPAPSRHQGWPGGWSSWSSRGKD